MTDHYIDERKRYVAEARKSFGTGYSVNTYEDDYSNNMEQSSSFSLFQFRFLIAVFLFCVYLFCDYTGTPIYQYTTEDIVTAISENEFYQKLENYVMIEMMQD